MKSAINFSSDSSLIIVEVEFLKILWRSANFKIQKMKIEYIVHKLNFLFLQKSNLSLYKNLLFLLFIEKTLKKAILDISIISKNIECKNITRLIFYIIQLDH
jgi:hypothetical protein